MRSVLATAETHLLPGRANATWSASWKLPRPRWRASLEPPSTTSGIALSVATYRLVTVFVIPGPEPTITTPGCRLT